jgi:hypothetical protein
MRRRCIAFFHILSDYWLSFDVHVTVHRVKFLIIKPTRCTNFLNLFLEWKSTCFGQLLCPSSRVFHCTQQWYMSYRFTDSLRAVSKHVWLIPKLSANLYDIKLLYVQWKTLDDGQRNCPKHVKFHSKNKFEKLVHLVGFIIRNTECVWPCTVHPVMLSALFSKPQVMQQLHSPKIIIIHQYDEDFDKQGNFVSWFVLSYSQWRTWTVDMNVGVLGSNDSNRDDGCLLGR